MKDLHIMVADKIATYHQRDGEIVCGNSDYQIVFTFDDEWDKYNKKTARFVWNGQYFDQEFTGDECAVPMVTDVDKIEVGVYAGSLATTTPASILCERSILCLTSEVQSDLLPSYRDQAVEAAVSAAKSAAEAKKAAEQAGGAGQDGEDGFSPIVTITEIDGGHRVTITDVNGTESFDVMDGVIGSNGSNGKDGIDGVGIASAVINENGELVLTYTDGNVVNLGVVVGKDGADGTNGTDASVDLSNYYTKDETYSSTEIDNLIAAAITTTLNTEV